MQVRTITTRRRGAALLAAVASLLMLMGVLAPSAAAKYQYNAKVGWLDAVYWPADGTQYGREYNGLADAAKSDQCVAVQRKSSVVGWTTEGVRDASTCNGRTFDWRITDDLAVQRTVAIRLIVLSGTNAGSYFNICNTKSECLAMRP